MLNLARPGAIWQRRMDMIVPRNHLGLAAYGGKLYAFGGQNLENEDSGNLAVTEEYDPGTDTWRMLTPIPVPLGHITPGVFPSAHGIFILGGYSNQPTKHATSLVFYSPVDDEWTVLSALEAEPSQVAGIIDGVIYAQVENRAYGGRIIWTERSPPAAIPGDPSN